MTIKVVKTYFQNLEAENFTGCKDIIASINKGVSISAADAEQLYFALDNLSNPKLINTKTTSKTTTNTTTPPQELPPRPKTAIRKSKAGSHSCCGPTSRTIRQTIQSKSQVVIRVWILWHLHSRQHGL